MSTPPSITFGVLSRSSFEQMLTSVFSPPQERLVIPLPPPSSEIKELDVTPVTRVQCIATTLGILGVKIWQSLLWRTVILTEDKVLLKMQNVPYV